MPRLVKAIMDDRVFEQIVMTLLARPVAFYPVFARVAGSTNAGIMLSQAWYWTLKLPEEREGWFYKTSAEWERETALTRKEQGTARGHLKKAKLLEERRQGTDATLFYRINMPILLSLLEFQCAKRHNGVCRLAHSIAPNSTLERTKWHTLLINPESTTETTSDIPSAGADGAQVGGNPSKLPQDAPETAKPAQTARKAKKTARAKPDGEGDGTGEKVEPWTNPFCAVFAERYESRWDGWEYKFSGRDFKAFKEIRATQGESFTLPAFIRATTHYFQSPPKPKHTIWHLLDNFAVYYQGPLNKFNQLETENSYANQRIATTGQANGIAANGSAGNPRPLEFKSKRSI